MKFTRDICRLLGIGGDGPDEQEEMEVGGGAADQTDISQDTLSGEECLSEEERNRRRAEKRRAKRKRQKQRKKLEKEEKLEDSPGQGQQGGERGGGGGGAVWESDSDDDEKTAEEEKKKSSNTGRVTPFRSKKEPAHSPPAPPPPPPPALVPRAAAGAPPALVTTRNTGNNTRHNPSAPRRAVEEEPEWDVNSAFVAGAASHIKPKGRRGRAGQSSRENKENEARSNQVESSKDPLKRRGVALTEEGIQMFKQGLYSQAVDMFTAAIHCDPTDHRFYGNRSYCYWCLELYSAALSDAQRSIKLAPDWPKGYFRKGSALMGLKRYSDAEKAMEQVLKLDQGCEEATNELFNCRVLQLMDLGFDEFQAVLLLEKFTTVQAALGSCDLKVEHTSQQDLNGGPCPSLWVGNVTTDITEKDIRDLFKTCGEIESIRVLHERFCAFVNFKNANMAATALERLKGVELEGSRLVIRYPDRWLQRSNCGLNTSSAATGPRRSLPINGDECFFWRTTGCFYGDKCRFRHIPEQRGRDKKPWQP